MPAPTAILPDADQSSVLAALRSLHAAGVPTVAMAPHRRAPGLWSRATGRRLVAPDPARDPAGFAAALAEAGVEGIVLPSREVVLDALAGTALPAGVRPGVDLAVAAALRDKRALGPLARAAGLLTPRTLGVVAAHELPGLVDREVVVKPPRAGGRLETATVARGRADARRLAQALPPDEVVLVQERVRGPLLSVAVVVGEDGRLLRHFTERAVRTWPADAGSIAVSVSLHPDPDLAGRVAGIVAAAGARGLVQADLVLGPQGPVLLDVNPRLYGCLPLAEACGAGLVAAWWGVLTGVPVDGPSPRTPAGVRFRRLDSDLSGALNGHPGRLLRPVPRPVVGEAWRTTDPVPGVLRAAEAVAVRVRRRRRR